MDNLPLYSILPSKLKRKAARSPVESGFQPKTLIKLVSPVNMLIGEGDSSEKPPGNGLPGADLVCILSSDPDSRLGDESSVIVVYV